VVTPEGWLYDKEAVLQYILDKKAEYQKKLAEFEKQRDREFKALHSQVPYLMTLNCCLKATNVNGYYICTYVYYGKLNIQI